MKQHYFLFILPLLAACLPACSPPAPAPVVPLERFQKLRSDGSEVALQDGPWQCVLDRQTSLVWEVKQANENPQYDGSSYSWFDGQSGSAKGGSCGVDLPGMPFMKYQACDTQDLLAHLRQKKLCGFADWRLPHASELRTILLKHGYPGETMVPFAVLPRITYGPYWTGDTRAGEDGLPQVLSIHVGTGQEGWISSKRAAYAIAVTQRMPEQR